MTSQTVPVERDIEALIAFVESRQAEPHSFGRHANDCCSFALGAAKAATGHDRATKLKWKSEAQAMKVIAGFGSLEAAIDHYFQRIAPAQAMRGDFAGVPDPALGIHPMVVEGETLVAPSGTGLKRWRRSAMTVAWSITLPAPHPPAARSARAKR